jgi:hypothetical protein
MDISYSQLALNGILNQVLICICFRANLTKSSSSTTKFASITDIQFGSQVQMILISVPVVSTEIHVRGCIPVGIGDSESIYAQ